MLRHRWRLLALQVLPVRASALELHHQLLLRALQVLPVRVEVRQQVVLLLPQVGHELGLRDLLHVVHLLAGAALTAMVRVLAGAIRTLLAVMSELVALEASWSFCGSRQWRHGMYQVEGVRHGPAP